MQAIMRDEPQDELHGDESSENAALNKCNLLRRRFDGCHSRWKE